jgi:hypothetical protein
MQAAVDATADARAKGWRMEQQATYEDRLDQVKAQRLLASAMSLNPRITKPRQGISARRITAPARQATAAATWLGRTYTSGNDLVVGIEAILDPLEFDPDGTDAFESALEKLAPHLGFVASRPERELGNGPDVLWGIGSQTFLVIECKSGATADQIARHDLAQLAHSVNWFREAYGSDPERTPVLIHPAASPRSDAAPSPDDVVITREKLEALKTAVRGMFLALSQGNRWSDETAVGSQLRAQRLTAGEFVAAFTTRPHGRRTRR